MSEIQIPKIRRREFGFTFNGHLDRHFSFHQEKQLNRFILKYRPTEAFVSIAYYENPSGRPMKNKKWQGSDLFFDVDAVSIRDAYMDTKKILKSLQNDFGLDKAEIAVNFSGRRGYHTIVFSEDKGIQKLGGKERGEIIEFLKVRQGVENIDPIASTDIHRLRRLEGSQNAKSGKLCRRITNFEQRGKNGYR
jgi:DNA primase small subunit